jgi:murein DD-endopeptidase MepM/ murein hydrolase activator NlpD
MNPPRRLRPGLIVALAAALVLLCCGGGVVSFFMTAAKDRPSSPLTLGCGNSKPIDPNAQLPRASALGAEQMHNAAIIIQVGQQMHVPPRGWIIAIATALQESYLRNLPNLGARNDHDSVGLFQQRPSQGWGTVAQIMDPAYASRKFYEKLLTVSGWQTMALTDAAQAVQRSAFPNAYAKHEPLASLVVNLLTGGAANAVGTLTSLRCAAAGEIAASGWTAPLRGEIVSGFRTPSRPNHQGVDIAAAKGTPIHAAAAGIVLKVRCNAVAPDGSDWGCDRDGSPSIHGCGWYVDILHAGGFITRYCHQVTRPLVAVGQQVAPGQQIGWSGSTGNSSGPHLHFETHINGDASSNGAVDPVRFMRERGAPLGAQP